jgi:hypothetical protein
VRIVALAGLVIFVCLSVIFGLFLMVRAVMFVLPSVVSEFRVLTDALRVILSLALAYSWLRLWKVITDWYFWRSVGAVMRNRDSS